MEQAHSSTPCIGPFALAREGAYLLSIRLELDAGTATKSSTVPSQNSVLAQIPVFL
jgi:hypothetical protein